MQCHNCPHNGKPTEKCITCNAADYLDNDFKTVVPVADIQHVSKSIDKDYLDNKYNSTTEYYDNKTQKNAEDCSKILQVLKTCDISSYKHIACLLAIFMSLGSHASLLTAMLNGENFTEYAKRMNLSKQTVSKTWNAIIENNKILKSIKSNKYKKRMNI